MRTKTVLLCLLAALSFTSCVKEDPSWPPSVPVELELVPRWNGAPFDKNQVYLSAANERVLIQQVKFYLSGITLEGEEGAALLSQAELFDLTNGASKRRFNIPSGAYSGLRFGLGLPPELNHADITAIDPSSPLGNNGGMYWSWTTLYRFIVFDGRYDTDAAATGALPYQFSIHTGRDTCYREGSIALSANAEQGSVMRVVLDVDIARFFTDGQQVLDLSQGAQVHGEVQTLPVALKLSDLALKAITLE